jgi:rare lipoprotein A
VLVLLICGTAISGGPIPLAAGAADASAPAASDTPADAGAPPAHTTKPAHVAHLDRTGRKRVGKASFYAKRFAGKRMADGTPMQPQGNNAASKTLPLGTTAKVTNLETGQSAVVTIRDRGPYVKDRIVDLSPATAQKIGIDHKEGVAEVAVTPIDVPQPETPKSTAPH